MLDKITPVILTYNEEPNIARVLEKLDWAGEIVVVDSFSSDGTLSILRTHPNVRLLQRKFDTFARQWNFALAQVRTDWVLSLDADYVLSGELVREMSGLSGASDVSAYSARFDYSIFGKPLRTSLMPPRHILFRRDRASYFDDGHTQRLKVLGAEACLEGRVNHDDRKPLSRWLASQSRYAQDEAVKLRTTPFSRLPLQDKVRRCIFLAPPLILFYCLFVKGLILDGWRGIYYSLQRMSAEACLSAQLILSAFKGEKR